MATRTAKRSARSYFRSTCLAKTTFHTQTLLLLSRSVHICFAAMRALQMLSVRYVFFNAPNSPTKRTFQIHFATPFVLGDIRRACPLHPCSLLRSTTTHKENTDAREHALHNCVCISASLARHAAPYENVVVSAERSVRDVRVLHPAVPRRTVELYHIPRVSG